jgi:hypothetical protein
MLYVTTCRTVANNALKHDTEYRDTDQAESLPTLNIIIVNHINVMGCDTAKVNKSRTGTPPSRNMRSYQVHQPPCVPSDIPGGKATPSLPGRTPGCPYQDWEPIPRDLRTAGELGKHTISNLVGYPNLGSQLTDRSPHVRVVTRVHQALRSRAHAEGLVRTGGAGGSRSREGTQPAA